MWLLGADGYFRSQAELAAIIEASTGVDEDGRGIDFVHKSAGVCPIIGQDALGMFCAVGVHVVDSFGHIRHHFNAQDEGQPFLIKVIRSGRYHSR